METEALHVNRLMGSLHQYLPVIAPILLVSISYIDPGKWAATVEGGARFGFDLLTCMLVFNLAAILCQYLSARIVVVTGRDLGQICSDEYDKCTVMFLGIQAELSAILLDLTMILGIANGLNLLFGWDLFTCVFFTAVDAALFPIIAAFLEENSKAEMIFTYVAFVLLPSFFLGVLFSQPEIPVSMPGMLTKLTGDSTYALMSLLGASIMPHNFYLHSFLVKRYGGLPNISKDTLCHYHFFAISGIFSGIFLVNYVLMNSAVNVFYSTGLILLTFQDALSLIEQAFRSPLMSVAFLLIINLSNKVTTLGWSQGGQIIMQDFLKLDLPGWLHCSTIRILTIVPSLYCVWNSGAEGMYQLLIFSQVMIALLLPSSVIPLFRIASSRPIMGVHKVSQFVEFLALMTCIGLLGLKINFVMEMIFGNSDWAGNLRWNMGSILSISYLLLLIVACASFCLMLWLAATPLKSANAQSDAQLSNWDKPNPSPELSVQREEIDINAARCEEETPYQKQETSQKLGEVLGSYATELTSDFDPDLPGPILESDQEFHLPSMEESYSNSSFTTSLINNSEESMSTVESVPAWTVIGEVSMTRVADDRSSTTSFYKAEESTSTAESIPAWTAISKVSMTTAADNSPPKIDLEDPVEKTVGVEGDLQIVKEDDRSETSEPEESIKGVPESAPSTTSDGPGSFRSVSGRSEEGGSGGGSLSRLAGLGRAARRQLTTVLDEFWGQLYDFHGQVTQEAKAKKLNSLISVESDPVTASQKLDATVKEVPGYYSSDGGRGSDPFVQSSLYDSPSKQRIPAGFESMYEGQGGSSLLWPNHMQLLDAYVQNSNQSAVDSGERRYSSVRNLSSGRWDCQPATIHGYQNTSHLAQQQSLGGANHGDLKVQVKSSIIKTQSLGGANHRDSLAFALGQQLQNGLGAGQVSGFQNRAVSRNRPLQSERQYYELFSLGTTENLVNALDAKKYHSSPNIHRDIYVSDNSAQWNSPTGFRSSTGRNYEPALDSLALDELSPSKVDNNMISPQLSSRWSRQPLEKFGVANESHATGTEAVEMLNSISQEAASIVDLEARLLQSLRHCVVRLIKLEGSDWLFRQNDGADEELINSVAVRERFLYDVETREINRVVQSTEPRYLSSDHRKSGFGMNTEASCFRDLSISSVPHCGDDCIWKSDLITSFGVWCIHRILDLSLMESRPELWGKYTYVLNRLQGIIDIAFSKPRSPMAPCFCLQIPQSYQQRLSPPIVSNGTLPPKPTRGKCTNAATLLDMIKDVEISISCRKGRTGTAAGDVAFPKGKENLASVLKRYKRRLSNKPSGSESPATRKAQYLS